MAHVLTVTTLKIGHPMALVILMIAHNGLLHDGPLPSEMIVEARAEAWTGCADHA